MVRISCSTSTKKLYGANAPHLSKITDHKQDYHLAQRIKPASATRRRISYRNLSPAADVSFPEPYFTGP